MSVPLPRTADLRPDLHGVDVDLDHANCPAIDPGETAMIRIAQVRPADEDDPNLVLLVGDWRGPDGNEAGVHVLAYASALPARVWRSGPVAGLDRAGEG
jgi:hypothetical protein